MPEYISRAEALRAVQKQRGANRSPAQNDMLDRIAGDGSAHKDDEEIGVLAGDRSTLYRRNMVHVDIPYDHCPVCGATLCSRWHNFCGKCGAKMDGAAE